MRVGVNKPRVSDRAPFSVQARERPAREVNRNIVAGGKFRHAAAMVAVLVRDDDRIQITGFQPEAADAEGYLAQPEAAVEQYPRVSRLL